jgi:surface protein
MDSEARIYSWYDDETQKIKYYTKAKNVYLNEDSSYMFYGLKKFELLDLNQFKTDFVTNMNYMFAFSFTSSE